MPCAGSADVLVLYVAPVKPSMLGSKITSDPPGVSAVSFYGPDFSWSIVLHSYTK